MYIYIYIYFFFFSLEIISIFLPDIKERCDISFPLSGSSPKILKFLRDICAKRAYRKKRKSLTQVNARFHDQWKNLGGIAQDICALFDIASMLLNTADTAYLPPPPPEAGVQESDERQFTVEFTRLILSSSPTSLPSLDRIEISRSNNLWSSVE